ncbi:hypothetical protein DSO57_1010564 [Entomophthora muscae]|uniref:Uncharacterized protein n=1 Tax=Entomophthora muscae TaxID=34485 RepID=A0ACC2THL3_9FUNG|nr:hypothetical protein DSO57_1010564 [Entomophthora muscae]
MILPVLKFVVFSLAPFLLLLWSTLPDLWSKITSSSWLVGKNPSSLLNLPNGLLFSGEAVVKSLTCDNLDLDDAVHAPFAPVEQFGALTRACVASPHPHPYALVAHWFDADGIECLVSSAIPCVLSVVPSLSGCPSFVCWPRAPAEGAPEEAAPAEGMGQLRL